MPLSQEVWKIRGKLSKTCPAAVMVSAGLLMMQELERADMIRTNFEHEMHFHLISRYEMVMVETANLLGDNQCHYCEGWPVQHAWRALVQVIDFIKKRVASAREFLSRPSTVGGGADITDEAHAQALEDIKVVMEKVGLEWWPCRGTLIALLRHGRRSAVLASGRVDVVDHDVDVMVGIPSVGDWMHRQRWEVNQALMERGWDACFGRYSVDHDHGTLELQLAREDLILCTRRNPEIVLDIATYVIDKGQSVYAQRYCTNDLHGGAGCYVPRDSGTLRAFFGRLRKSAIHPLQRCKAYDSWVPCPVNPLETLKATMKATNFTRHCVAFPDVAERKRRGYLSDQQMTEQLTLEDVEMLRKKAAQFDHEGYMSMTPYFSSCDVSVFGRS